LHEFFQCDTTIPSSAAAAAVATYFHDFHITASSAVQDHFDELRGTAAAITTTARAYGDEFHITVSTAKAHFDELRRPATTTDEAYIHEFHHIAASAAKARFDELRAAGAA
jgi:hypothetical protein